jgi:magnesium transporter
MARFIKDRTKATGQAPGSLVFLGNRKMDKPIIQLMEYDADRMSEKELTSIEEGAGVLDYKGVSWINIYGIHDLEMIQRIGEIFNIHSLFLEDVLNTDQPPKYDDGENYDAFILKMLHLSDDSKEVIAEQITIILGANFLITLQERPGDVFTPVRERIRNKKGRVRLNDNDYLAYALMDTIVDNYILLIETLGFKVEELEDRIFLKKDDKIIEEIYNYKTEINFLRKSIRPVKDFLTILLKSENSYFQEKNMKYLRDLNELVVQSTDTIELYNNMLSDQLNIYNTNVNNRMNEVMKVLTIFASIFIPLTFFAGIYGMNFEYMPELKIKMAYPLFWIIALVTMGSLLIYFKRKKWL